MIGGKMLKIKNKPNFATAKYQILMTKYYLIDKANVNIGNM